MTHNTRKLVKCFMRWMTELIQPVECQVQTGNLQNHFQNRKKLKMHSARALQFFFWVLVLHSLQDRIEELSNYGQIKKKRIQKKNETYEIHVSTTILIMIVAFLGSWTPYAFLALYVVITKNNQIHPLLATFPLVLAKCAPIWNPYIYFMRDTKFNHECRKMLPILSRLGLWRVNPGSQDDHVMNLNDTISRKTSTYV